jgi:3-oxoacyl-[acyl-carrier protein] reductase
MARVAIVTGVAHTMGAATAARLAAAGMHVAVLDADEAGAKLTAEHILDQGGRAVAICLDPADTATVQAAVARAAAELGPPTVLVNHAGAGPDGPLSTASDDHWDGVATQLRAAFLMSRAVLDSMTEQWYGRIVNVAGIVPLDGYDPASDSTATAGLAGFTRTLAMELGPLNITVNAVVPRMIADDARFARGRYEASLRQTAERVAVRRLGRPADVAHAVAFLVGEDSSFVSGQILFVAGGPA